MEENLDLQDSSSDDEELDIEEIKKNGGRKEATRQKEKNYVNKWEAYVKKAGKV